MSEQRKIEWLAVQVMGWHTGSSPAARTASMIASKWNPFVDWADTGDLLRRCEKLGTEFSLPIQKLANQADICKAVFLALSA